MIYSIKDDLENVSADAFGKALKGLGLNLFVRQIAPYFDFLKEVFDMQAYQVTNDFAILMYADHIFQLHKSDPDICHNCAVERGDSIMQIPMDTPHGLGE